LAGVLQAQERGEGGLDDVVRVRRTQRLREHVGDARNLHDLAHGAAGDYAGAFRGRLQQNLRRAIAPGDLVRNRGTLHVELDQVLFGLLNALLDGHGDFAGFAHAESGVAVIVADDDERRKAEVLAALDDLGDAVDGNDVVLQIRRIDFEKPPNRQTLAQNLLRHLDLYPPSPPRIRGPLDAAVILVTAAVEHYLGDARRLGALGNHLADRLGGGDVAATLQVLLGLLVDGAGGDDGAAAAVVDDLRVDVRDGAIHVQARTLRRADKPRAHAGVHAPAMGVFG